MYIYPETAGGMSLAQTHFCSSFFHETVSSRVVTCFHGLSQVWSRPKQSERTLSPINDSRQKVSVHGVGESVTNHIGATVITTVFPVYFPTAGVRLVPRKKPVSSPLECWRTSTLLGRRSMSPQERSLPRASFPDATNFRLTMPRRCGAPWQRLADKSVTDDGAHPFKTSSRCAGLFSNGGMPSITVAEVSRSGESPFPRDLARPQWNGTSRRAPPTQPEAGRRAF